MGEIKGMLKGLSPRVRGNSSWGRNASEMVGSIPAGAGEPIHHPTYEIIYRVYPRGCGGTDRTARRSLAARGLSPRVRGNQQHNRLFRTPERSIPAGAGEPESIRRGSGVGRVYPRGCGGTNGQRSGCRSHRGLSPRVRGNPEGVPVVGKIPRSIPAGAGEPDWGFLSGVLARVYPRGCGGTIGQCANPGFMAGLSPRVRGNRSKTAENVKQEGSIPAGAGEPGLCGCASWRPPVYPRGCGGTFAFAGLCK